MTTPPVTPKGLESQEGDATQVESAILVPVLDTTLDAVSAPEAETVPDTDVGPGKKMRVSERRCILTRRHGHPDRMLRVVVGPDGQAVADLGARLPGRGMWLSATHAVLVDPKLGAAMSRAARREVKLPEGFVKLVQEGLARRAQDGISLARRAGEAVCGFQKCRDKITSGKAGLVICAVGASQDELSRLVSGHRTLPVVWVPERFLAVAFGRGKAVYAVVAPGALAQRLKTECERFWGVAEGTLPDPAVRPARVS